MRIRSLRLVFFSMLIAMSNTQAMHLDRSGLGQVLISPYYTVNGGHQTLITVLNHTGQGKALKLRFREGMNGRAVFDFNLYLAPHDLWTGALFSQSDDGPATLITADDSCTVPALKTSTSLPTLANGRRIAPFGNAAFTGANDDAGPDHLTRSREGYFEIIEMGEVVNAAEHSLDDVAPGSNGIPSNCARIQSAWAQGGYWQQRAQIDLNPPAGGLAATVSLVDASNGSMYTFAAEAIDRFSSIVQHSGPGNPLPDLSSGITSRSEGTVEALVEIEGSLVAARYPIARAIDAVSALLAAEYVDNEYVSKTASASTTAWVVTFPTRRFYTDDALLQGNAIAPFTRKFSEAAVAGNFIVPVPPVSANTFCPELPAARGEAIDAEIFDREAGPSRFDCDYPYDRAFFLFQTAQIPSLFWASNVLQFYPNVSNAAAVTPLASGLGQRVNAADFGVDEGWMRLHFYAAPGFDSLPNHLLRPDQSGRRFVGLPMVGFSATNFTNGQLQPGVLSNYASLRRHRISKRQLPMSP